MQGILSWFQLSSSVVTASKKGYFPSLQNSCPWRVVVVLDSLTGLALWMAAVCPSVSRPTMSLPWLRWSLVTTRTLHCRLTCHNATCHFILPWPVIIQCLATHHLDFTTSSLCLWCLSDLRGQLSVDSWQSRSRSQLWSNLRPEQSLHHCHQDPGHGHHHGAGGP